MLAKYLLLIIQILARICKKIEARCTIADFSLYHVKHNSRFINTYYLIVPCETFSSNEYRESRRRVFILACAGLCVVSCICQWVITTALQRFIDAARDFCSFLGLPARRVLIPRGGLCVVSSRAAVSFRGCRPFRLPSSGRRQEVGRDGDSLKVALAVHDTQGKAEPIHAAGAEWDTASCRFFLHLGC